MLKSMTAFARHDQNSEAGTFTWELRSVNHRYLEPSFRLPEQFRELEIKLRESLRKKLARGKIECSLKWQPSLKNGRSLRVNVEMLEGLKSALQQISDTIENCAPYDAVSLLQLPGVLNSESSDRKSLLHQAHEGFNAALISLCDNRQREGQQLAPLFDQRLRAIEQIITDVRSKMPAILAKQKQTILQRFEEAKIEIDAQRLEQELVMIAQKTDVAEELDRLDAHVVEVNAVLKKTEPVGRRLDFLMQELNREANTLSSKSIVTDTTNAAVELKVLIEQMREQVQNIE